MTEVERRDRGEGQNGDKRFEVMLSVNDVRRSGKTRKIVDYATYRHGGTARLV